MTILLCDIVETVNVHVINFVVNKYDYHLQLPGHYKWMKGKQTKY